MTPTPTAPNPFDTPIVLTRRTKLIIAFTICFLLGIVAGYWISHSIPVDAFDRWRGFAMFRIEDYEQEFEQLYRATTGGIKRCQGRTPST